MSEGGCRNRLYRFVVRTNNSVLFHMVMTGVWVILIIPTLIWWSESILWILLISIYANVVGHLSAVEAAQAKAEQQRPADPLA